MSSNKYSIFEHCYSPIIDNDGCEIGCELTVLGIKKGETVTDENYLNFPDVGRISIYANGLVMKQQISDRINIAAYENYTKGLIDEAQKKLALIVEKHYGPIKLDNISEGRFLDSCSGKYNFSMRHNASQINATAELRTDGKKLYCHCESTEEIPGETSRVCKNNYILWNIKDKHLTSEITEKLLKNVCSMFLMEAAENEFYSNTLFVGNDGYSIETRTLESVELQMSKSEFEEFIVKVLSAYEYDYQKIFLNNPYFEVIGRIESHHEYLTSGTIGSYHANKLYGCFLIGETLEKRYFKIKEEDDDFYDVDAPSYEEISLDEIVEDFAAAIIHEDVYTDVYKGCVTDIAEDVVDYTLNGKYDDYIRYQIAEKSNEKSIKQTNKENLERD